MLRHIPRWTGRAATALVIGLTCPILTACGESNNNTAVPVDLSPKVSAFAAISQLEARAQGTPADSQKDLRGPDANDNGIRDDIDTYIAMRNYTPKQKKAVEQLARGIQKAILVDKSDRPSMKYIGDGNMRAIHCLGSIDRKFANETVQIYQKLSANTAGRARAYRAFDHALDGSGWDLPEGDSCED